jgi:hypothetical protein
MWTLVPPLLPEPLHDAAVRMVNKLSATRTAMRFFMVFVSPVTFTLIGCVDLFSTEACEKAPGVRERITYLTALSKW